ncbi:hypothetical protein [Lysinibacillus sp. G4S2]|uniref:hypothetical protein n=1 Tax=Lysinibacillus sp. G4S2 TaxID=3055859 RepID=UPI00259FE7C4|nr:hypothetical protein [Lysinibacillus sp. G4S2]MDM5250050.1 hypothetical protein [Lysinibacillus sp. G4S2]
MLCAKATATKRVARSGIRAVWHMTDVMMSLDMETIALTTPTAKAAGFLYT